VYHFYSTAC